VSNTEARPAETVCAGRPEPGIEVIEARRVPLGGPRAMEVSRTLPTRDRSMIGAWCFADHYGPEDVAVSGGMRVLPHPHTGLQTVSWLFEGFIEHRDSAGVRAEVRPGQLNLMSAGRGISHSEVSTPETAILHGVQLWLALPERDRHGENGFEFYAPNPVGLTDGRGAPAGSAKVFLGTLAGSASPVPTATPVLGAELSLLPGGAVTLSVDPRFEHGALLDAGALTLAGVPLERAQLGYAGPGRAELDLRNPGAVPARLILLGGTPFDEDVVMWWNFMGRSHDEIAAYRAQWEGRDHRFGTVDGWGDADRIPAPPLPRARLRPRRR